jgi:hypothetical protein
MFSVSLFLLVVCLMKFGASSAPTDKLSIYFFAPAEGPKLINGGLMLSNALNALQVADVYSRLCGYAPLLFEGMFHLGLFLFLPFLTVWYNVFSLRACQFAKQWRFNGFSSPVFDRIVWIRYFFFCSFTFL